MANYENIKPYSDFAHEAAQHGGVEKYLDEFAELNKKIGIVEEKNSELWKGTLLIAASLFIWESGKAGFKKYKEYRKNKKDEQEDLVKKSNNVKKAIMQEIN